MEKGGARYRPVLRSSHATHFKMLDRLYKSSLLVALVLSCLLIASEQGPKTEANALITSRA